MNNILSFDDFIGCKGSSYFSDYVLESLSISADVDNETRQVINFLNKSIRTGDVIKTKNISGHHIEVIKIPYKLHFDIFGCDCEFDFTFCNVSGVLNDFDFRKMFSESGLDITTFPVKKNVNGKIRLSFVMKGSIILNDMKFNSFSRSVIMHEIQHCYRFSKIYKDVDVHIVDTIDKRELKWKNIYNVCIAFLNVYETNDKFKRYMGKDFMNVIYTLYCCDVDEINAFVHQTFEECRDCRNEDELKSLLKKSMLYNIREMFKKVIGLFDDEEFVKEFEEKKKSIKGLDGIPDANKVIKILKRRYRTVCSKFGKVSVLLIDDVCGEKVDGKGNVFMRYKDI